MSAHTYIGGELELFEQARHWKRYWRSHLQTHLRGAVLEVGAGLGANTVLLRNGASARWVCLEPDPHLAAALQRRVAPASPAAPPEVRTGTIASLRPVEKFDTILYIDVLEHIEDDRGEVRQASAHLTKGGRLIVLSPAHPWLFSEFDRRIGHYRRYTARMLAALTPAGVRRVRAFYLDAVGLLASAANRLLLRQGLPRAGQLRFWDSVMVPCSRIIDPLTGHRFGKSVVCIWEKTD